MLTFLTLCVLAATVLLVCAESCYKTTGSYVYFTYCSGYCTGSYGLETCNYYSYSYYYNYSLYDGISAATIAGVVVGCLFGLVIVISVIVIIIKSVTKTTASHGRIVQPTVTSGDTRTVLYSTTADQSGQQPYSSGNLMYSGQPTGYPQSYPPNAGYPPSTSYPPPSQNATQPPPYSSAGYTGLTPVDTKGAYI